MIFFFTNKLYLNLGNSFNKLYLNLGNSLTSEVIHFERVFVWC